MVLIQPDGAAVMERLKTMLPYLELCVADAHAI